MVVWTDAHLSPALAPWLATTFSITATAVREIGLREAAGSDIFFAARTANAIVLTKDADFADLLMRHGPPGDLAPMWPYFEHSPSFATRTAMERY
jgi:predicted nuclease of predicted toxin-antitoxin system